MIIEIEYMRWKLLCVLGPLSLIRHVSSLEMWGENWYVFWEFCLCSRRETCVLVDKLWSIFHLKFKRIDPWCKSNAKPYVTLHLLTLVSFLSSNPSSYFVIPLNFELSSNPIHHGPWTSNLIPLVRTKDTQIYEIQNILI